ncbi:MAG TPA: hypothetical protein VG841_15885 [Caulobacterales bacterium]|nr:hypothetical protein [Caulobacterales bacterium]
MRRLLLATAAASALALAPFWAAAQDAYGPSPQTQTSPDMNAPPAMPPPTEPTPPPTAEPDMTAPDTTAPDTTAPDTQAQTAPPADAYGANPAPADNYATNASPSPEMVALVQEMGLSGVPMSAADVCAQRSVSLEPGNSMSRDQKVRFAVDYASVCKTQQVVIRAPRSQQARLQRIVEDHGVPAEMISTETASASDASMQMNFAGLATSSAQYAAIFNPQYAANTSYAPAPGASSYMGPTESAPQTPTPPPTTDYNNQTTTDTSPSDATTAPSDSDTMPPAAPAPNTY